MTEEEARQFAHLWIRAWNAHDLDAILAHYADDIVFVSPFIVTLRGEPTGTLHGKDALRAYFEQGLAAYPDLEFELFAVFTGVGSIALLYRSVQRLMALEVMQINPEGRVSGVFAHYASEAEAEFWAETGRLQLF
jgi:hypothetical protein